MHNCVVVAITVVTVIPYVHTKITGVSYLFGIKLIHMHPI